MHLRTTAMRLPLGRQATLVLAATLAAAGLFASASAASAASADDWYDNDYHSILPGTNNWYESGFSSTWSQPDAATSTWQNVSSWADTGSSGSVTKPTSIKLTDQFQIDGVNLSCQGGYPAGATCSVSGSSATVNYTTQVNNTTSVTHQISQVNLGGTVLTYAGEWAMGTFTVGSNTYEADAVESVGL